ncbi:MULTISPECIES: hypothetical protein [unclassified Bartonella]|uniref:hypothetical protein n=1 Tax=unclassified Bartonella TaxID=2645622 RepID=UPI0035D0C469
MVFIDFDPRDRRFISKLEKDLHERRLEKDLLQSIANQQKDKHKLPVFLNAISMNDPYKIGSFSPSPIGSIRPSEIDNEGNKPSPIPQSETPPQLETSPPISTKPVPLQEQPPEPNLSFWDKFSRFSQSDVSKNIDDFLMGAITASPNSSGWQLFAKGLKNLHEGDKQRGQVNQTVEYLKSKGYSEEEARFIAGNKDALNAFLLQKVNGGYDARSKEELDRQREMIELKNSEAISTNMLNDIERFMDYVNKNGDWSTGNLADWLAFFKVPQHRDMKSLLDSIKNRIGIDRLETMRRYSRNGASGFGNLTERELDILKSYLGEIDYRLGHKELMYRLKKIHHILGKMKTDVLSLLQNGKIELTAEKVHEVTSQTNSTDSQKGYNNQLPKMGVEEAASNGNITYFIDSSNGKVLVKEK